MKTSPLLIFQVIISILMLSCDHKSAVTSEFIFDANNNANRNGTKNSDTTYTPDEYNNTKGYWENGEIITSFDCPDSRFFPPIDIKSWNMIPVVNGRLPTYAETKNGTSIHHYGEKENAFVKPFSMTLPKLAYFVNPNARAEYGLNHHTHKLTQMPDVVVVIQIVQTSKDTIVGYRYLTGGCGGSVFRDFHFLTDDEVREVTHL